MDNEEDNYAWIRLQPEHGTWSWSVNFKRRGKMYCRRFYDPKHGGDAGAHEAAKAWRDRQLAQVQALGKLDFCQQMRSNNTSGAVGVHFLISPKQPLGVWQARLKLAGQRTQYKSVSVLKYGHQCAYELAVKARQAMLAKAQDQPYLYAELAKQMAKRTSGQPQPQVM